MKEKQVETIFNLPIENKYSSVARLLTHKKNPGYWALIKYVRLPLPFLCKSVSSYINFVWLQDVILNNIYKSIEICTFIWVEILVFSSFWYSKK